MSQNVVQRPQNITGILNNFKSLIKQVHEKGCTEKINNKYDPNSYSKSDLRKNAGKITYIEIGKAG